MRVCKQGVSREVKMVVHVFFDKHKDDSVMLYFMSVIMLNAWDILITLLTCGQKGATC